jgi:hypothetical protein
MSKLRRSYKKIAYKILVGKREGKLLPRKRRIILKQILGKQGGRM